MEKRFKKACQELFWLHRERERERDMVRASGISPTDNGYSHLDYQHDSSNGTASTEQSSRSSQKGRSSSELRCFPCRRLLLPSDKTWLSPCAASSGWLFYMPALYIPPAGYLVCKLPGEGAISFTSAMKGT